MSIRYLSSGDTVKAKQLLGEGRHQLSILKGSMSFQKLEQLQKTIRFDDGTIINCLSCFGQDVVNVYVPPLAPPREEKKKVVVQVFYCWCTDWFALGKITEVIGDYGEVGEYGEEDYPDYCNNTDTDIKNYIGIRYKVRVCQGTLLKLQAWTEYICLASDFAEYHIDDEVIVFMRGEWKETSIEEPDERDPLNSCECNDLKLCIACKGTTRPERLGEEADGSYLIMPLEIEGVNKS